MNICRLPFELLCDIIENVDSDDKHTLIACSMSFNALIGPTYRRLYRKIILDGSRIAQRFTRTISSQNSLHPPGRYVRDLSIYCDLPIHRLNSIFPGLAQNLPGLISLRLSFLILQAIDEQAKSALQAGFQSVQQLKLIGVEFDTEDQTFGLIASFPSLTYLGLIRHSTCGYRPFAHAPIPLPNGLEVLDISSRHIYIFGSLLRLHPSPNLRSLRIEVSGNAYRMLEFGSLLEFLGPSLESLTIYGSVEDMWVDAMTDSSNLNYIDELLAGRVISLVHNTHLRSITVHSDVFIDFADETLPDHLPSASWAISLLSQITSPHLSEINLVMVTGFLSALDRLDWPQLDEILTRPLWRDSLKQVVVNIRLSGQLLDAPDLDGVWLRLPMITAVPSVLCRIESRLTIDGY